MSGRVIDFIVFSLSIFLLQGCKQVECGKYNKFVDDSKSSEELLLWADGNIFDRDFSDSDLRVGQIVGPGGRFKSISLDRSGRRPPPGFLKDYEIKIVGPNQYHPNIIFIGRSGYKGVVVSRNEMDESVVGTEIISDLLWKRRGRIAVICYQEDENMTKKSIDR